MNIHERVTGYERGGGVNQIYKGGGEGVRVEREKDSFSAYEASRSFGKKHKDDSVEVIILVPEEEKKDFHDFPKEKRDLLPKGSFYVFFLALGTLTAGLLSLGPIAKTVEAYRYGMMPEFIPLDWGMLAFAAAFALFLIIRAASGSGSSSRVTGTARRKIFEEREEKERF